MFEADISGKNETPARPSGLGLEYLFRGWYTSDSLADDTLFDWANATMPFGGLVLYPKWERNPVQVIYFSALEGGSSEAVHVPYGQSLVQAGFVEAMNEFRDVPPGMSESNFKGWYRKDANGRLIAFDLNDPILLPVTIFPVYVGQPYQVTYEAGDGSGTVPVDNGLYVFGARASVLGKGGLTAPDNQVFLGWRIQGDATNKVYAPNDTIFINADITLVAVFGPVTQLTKVTYKPGTGTGNDLTLSGLENNATHTVLGIGSQAGQANFTKPGYLFTGWLADGETYKPGDQVMLDTNDQDNANVFVA